jgi:large subunit ribosomal protein L29
VTADEIRDLTDAEIEEKIGQNQEELFRLRFRSATQQLENPSLIRKLRRDIARMKTIQRQRVDEQAAGASSARRTR